MCVSGFVLAVTLVPELFKKVGETGRNNFHQVSSKSELLGPRYEQKAEQVASKKATTIKV